jgi:hypothetical protein
MFAWSNKLHIQNGNECPPLPHQEGLPPVHVESIVAATVLQSADHHYSDCFPQGVPIIPLVEGFHAHLQHHSLQNHTLIKACNL